MTFSMAMDGFLLEVMILVYQDSLKNGTFKVCLPFFFAYYLFFFLVVN